MLRGKRFVPSDPLLKEGEEYMFFLDLDEQRPPINISGAPRYTSVGIWSGKVKITDKAVQFLPRAADSLHHFGDEVWTWASFLTKVKERITILYPGEQPAGVHVDN